MKNFTKLTFYLIVLPLAFVCGVQAQSVSRGPYLQNGTPNSVVVRWRTSTSFDSLVKFGTTENLLDQQVSDNAPKNEHEIEITGLQPDTKYFYSIGTSSTVLASGPDYFFVTPPIAGTEKNLRLWILGDSGTANSAAASVRTAYQSFTGSTHTNLWLMLGDNAYNNGTDSEYQNAVFNMYPEMLRKSVLWPTIGNHDVMNSSSTPYLDIFTLPTQGEAGGVPSGTENYYSFDWAHVHFVCLDSDDSSRAIGGPMLTWLEDDLSNHTQPFTIVFFHHPPYTKGSHNSDSESQLIQVRERFVPIMEDYGVDLVFCGHSHSYERSFLINGHHDLSGTFNPATHGKDMGNGREDGDGAYRKFQGGNNGSVYVVAGASGRTGGGSLNHPAMFHSISRLGSCILDVESSKMTLQYITSTGTVEDYFTLQKDLLNVDTTVPAVNSEVATPPTQFSVAFSKDVQTGTVASADFMVNGVPADGVTITDGKNVTFTFNSSPVTQQGTQTMQMLEGSITSTDNEPLAPFSGTFTYDAVNLMVTATTPAANGILDMPVSTVQLQFNEAVFIVDSNQIQVSNGSVSAASKIDPQIIEVEVSDLTEGPITLSLEIGAVEDSFGFGLDATFEIDFIVDDLQPLNLSPWNKLLPKGSLAFSAEGTASLYADTDTDSFLLTLDSGQRLSVLLSPAPELKANIRVLDTESQQVGQQSASNDGDILLLNNLPVLESGNYFIEVSAEPGSSGTFQLKVLLNATFEEEPFTLQTNDGRAEAVELNPLLISEGNTQRTVIAGRVSQTSIFEHALDTLDGSWTTYSSDAAGRVLITDVHPPFEGTGALFMDRATAGGYTLNEAVLTVDLSNIPGGILEFRHAEFSDEEHSFAGSFTDHANADGVAISADGTTWYPAWLPINQTFGNWQQVRVDLGAAVANAGINLSSDFKIKFQQYDDFPLISDGRAFDALKILRVPDDWYAIDLGVGDRLTLTLNGGSTKTLELYDNAGNFIDVVSSNATNLNHYVRDIDLGTPGRYFVKVAGAAGDYQLGVYVNAGFDTEPNDGSFGQYAGFYESVYGSLTGSDLVDGYRMNLQVGATLNVITETPGDGPFGFENNLDPRVELLDAQGVVVASDLNSAPDGKNSSFSFTAVQTGSYLLRVFREANSGEYILNYSGHSVQVEPFEVIGVTPSQGTQLHSVNEVRLILSKNIDVNSVSVSDLLINGSTPSFFTQINPRELVFGTPQNLSEGIVTIELPPGAILSTIAESVQGFVSTFELLGPTKVVSSSVNENDELVVQDLVLNFSFNNEIDSNGLDVSDFELSTNALGIISPSSWSYDAPSKTLGVTYLQIQEGQYQFTLFSGNDKFEDITGYALDGEATAFPMPPNSSGDGIEGGNFVVNFSIDKPTTDLSSSFVSIPPLGSQAYQVQENGVIGDVTDVDVYRFDLDANQYLTIALSNSLGLVGNMDLTDGNVVLASSAATTPDSASILRTSLLQAGSYEIHVSSDQATTGAYDLEVFLNSELEDEKYSSSTNDSLATAQDLSGQFIPQPSNGKLYSVLGDFGSGGSGGAARVNLYMENFNSGVLSSSWSTYSAGPEGRVRVLSSPTPAEGSHALYMDRSPSGSGLLNEAIYEVDLTGRENVELAFSYNDYDEEFTNLGSTPWVDHRNGDGIAVSTDGVNWYPIWNANNVSSWQTVQIDISAAVANAGLTLNNQFRIKFQQYDTHSLTTDGIGIDNIVISASTSDDWFKVNFEQGDQINAYVKSLQGQHSTLELYNAQGSLLQTGSQIQGNVDLGINDYTIPSTGDYLFKVSSNTLTDYHLFVLKNGIFDINSLTPQPTSGNLNMVGAVEVAAENDEFQVSLTAVDQWSLNTSTPADGSDAFENSLDPALEILDSNLNVVASDDNSATDGKNAELVFSPGSAGTYTVRITGANTSVGEYVVESSVINTDSTPPQMDVNSILLKGSVTSDGQGQPATKVLINGQEATLTNNGFNWEISIPKIEFTGEPLLVEVFDIDDKVSLRKSLVINRQ